MVTMLESVFTVNESIGQVQVCANITGTKDILIKIEISTRQGTAGTLEPLSEHTIFWANLILICSAETGVLSDFVPFIHQLTFEPHDTQKCINVTIIDDTIVENTETFYVDLTQTPDLDSRVVIVHGTSTIEITDDDGNCTLFIFTATHSNFSNSCHSQTGH